MAAEHVHRIDEGLLAWNAWRDATNQSPADLSGADLSNKKLQGYNLQRVILRDANLRGAQLGGAHLKGADLEGANLEQANLEHVNAREANFDAAHCRGARFIVATLRHSTFRGADLRETDFYRAYLRDVDLTGANLSGARLGKAQLENATCEAANLTDVDLRSASLVRTNFRGANLSHAKVYGTATWNVDTAGAQLDELLITRTENEPPITVSELEGASFLSLVLDNSGIRRWLDLASSKLVLVLGRFTPERKALLDATRAALRQNGYVSFLFDFERPASTTYREVIATMAGLSRFVVADISAAKVVLQELDIVLSNFPSVPVCCLLQEGEALPTTMLDHANRASLVAIHRYHDGADLMAKIPDEIIRPCEDRARALRARLEAFARMQDVNSK